MPVVFSRPLFRYSSPWLWWSLSGVSSDTFLPAETKKNERRLARQCSGEGLFSRSSCLFGGWWLFCAVCLELISMIRLLPRHQISQAKCLCPEGFSFRICTPRQSAAVFRFWYN